MIEKPEKHIGIKYYLGHLNILSPIKTALKESLINQHEQNRVIMRTESQYTIKNFQSLNLIFNNSIYSNLLILS